MSLTVAIIQSITSINLCVVAILEINRYGLRYQTGGQKGPPSRLKSVTGTIYNDTQCNLIVKPK